MVKVCVISASKVWCKYLVIFSVESKPYITISADNDILSNVNESTRDVASREAVEGFGRAKVPEADPHLFHHVTARPDHASR